MKKVLITGVTGFTGYHQAKLLVDQGYRVYGLAHQRKRITIPCQSVFYGDIRDEVWLKKTITTIEPNWVFHFAVVKGRGISLEQMLEINVCGTQRLLEILCVSQLNPTVILPGSAAEYGWVESSENPVYENQALRPVSDYGLSKVAQSLLAEKYIRKHGMKIIRPRTFNTTGPGEPDSLVCSAFAKQIVQIQMGKQEPILQVGNISSSRDFLDIRDVVAAYTLLADKGEPGEIYNVCSSQAVPISVILQTLLKTANLSEEVCIQENPFARVDVPEIYGDATKLRTLGWKPKIRLERSLLDLLNEWRVRSQERDI